MKTILILTVFTFLAMKETYGAVSSTRPPAASPGSPVSPDAAVTPTTTAAPPKIVGLSVSALASRRPIFFPRRNLLKNATSIKAPVVKRQDSLAAVDDAQVTLDENLPVKTDDIAVDPVPEDTSIVESDSESKDNAETPAEDPASGEDNTGDEPNDSDNDSSERANSSETSELDNTDDKEEHSIAKRSFDSPVVLLIRDIIHRFFKFANWILELVGLARWVQFFMDKFNAVDSVVPLRRPAAELLSRSVSPEWRALADLAYDSYYNYDL